MLLPIGRFANSESRLVALFFGYVVGRQRAADGLVHHRQAVIREGLIVHLASLRKKAVADVHSDGFSYSHNNDRQQVTRTMRRDD
jgi:hypothetical protein